MIRLEIKSSAENKIVMSSKEYGRYFFKGLFSSRVMLEKKVNDLIMIMMV